MGVAVLQRPGEQYQRQAAHRQRVRGGRQHPKAFGIALGWKLLGRFYYEGRDYEFNFSKFWTGSRTFFDCQETDTEIRWKVVQTAFRAKMEVESPAPRRRCSSSITSPGRPETPHPSVELRKRCRYRPTGNTPIDNVGPLCRQCGMGGI